MWPPPAGGFLQLERGFDCPSDVSLEVGRDGAGIEGVGLDAVLVPACRGLDREGDDGGLGLPIGEQRWLGRKGKLMSSKTTGERRCPLEDTATIRALPAAANAGWSPRARAKWPRWLAAN
jgi:hypothetical protein